MHTELFSDGLMALVERGVVTGVRKQLQPHEGGGHVRAGHAALYDFLHENAAVELWPVRYVNDPRLIGQEHDFVSINATLEVDLLGQCASESIGSRTCPRSGGQADFARGAMYSEGGQGFIVLRSTTTGHLTRSCAQLHPGAVVTTIKNTVDRVVTEHGVAELRGHTVAQRARALIDVAHPDAREQLHADAERLGILHG